MPVQNEKDFPHADLTGKIIKCCMEAHSFLGPGFPEATYHKAVLKELCWAILESASEREVTVIYKDGSALDVFRPNVIVSATGVVEFKALSALNDDHISQVLSYLKATNLQIGLLFNFGEQHLRFRRLINKYYDASKSPNLSR
jgi:GxxExxY protein